MALEVASSLVTDRLIGKFKEKGESWLTAELTKQWTKIQQRKYKGLVELAEKKPLIGKIAYEVLEAVLPEIEKETDGLDTKDRKAIAEEVVNTLTQAHLTDDLFSAHDFNPDRLTRTILAGTEARVRTIPRFQQTIHNTLIAFIVGELIRRTQAQSEAEKRELQEILKMAGLLDTLVDRPDREATLFEQEYRNAIAERFNKFDPFGIQEVDRKLHRFTLLDAFVFPNLRLGTQRHWRTQDEILRGTWETEMPPLKSARDALVVSRRILLRGSAGLGKTTLLRWLAVTLATEQPGAELEELHAKRRVPFVVQLRDCKTGNCPSALELVAHSTEHQLAPPTLQWTTNLLREGRGWILIDGLDEVPEAQRESILKGIRSLMRTYKQCRFFLSSRPDPIKENKWQALNDFLEQEEFTELDIDALQPPQVAQLITNWYDAAATVERDAARKRTLKRLAPALIQHVEGRLALRRLADTPLLCAMLSLLYSENQNLPSERIELYEKSIEMLLNRDGARHITKEIDIKSEHLRGYFQALAYWMSYSDGLEQSREEVKNKLAKLITAYPVAAEKVLKHMIERVQLLQEPASDKVAFSHRSFQELFTAAHLFDQGILTKKWVRDHALNSFWHETLVLAIGLAPRALVKVLITELLGYADKQPEADAKTVRLLALAAARMAHAKKDVSDLLATVLEAVKPYFPPRSEEEVDALIPAGEGAIPLLKREMLPSFQIEDLANFLKAEPIKEMIVACIRTLAGIGGDSALGTLIGYAPLANHHKTIAIALSMAWDAFDREQFVLRVLSHTETLVIWRDPQDLPLHQLTTIKHLYIYNVSEVPFLTQPWARQLERLVLENTQVSDVSTLAKLANLQSLSLSGTQVSDVSTLTKLANLRYLRLDNTQVSDVSMLRERLPRLAIIGV